MDNNNKALLFVLRCGHLWCRSIIYWGKNKRKQIKGSLGGQLRQSTTRSIVSDCVLWTVSLKNKECEWGSHLLETPSLRCFVKRSLILQHRLFKERITHLEVIILTDFPNPVKFEGDKAAIFLTKERSKTTQFINLYLE